jgi:Uma2 family endonuclease
MSTVPSLRISPLEYLARERAADRKSEYFQGQVFAMAGASPNHNRIVRNVLTHLDAQLRGGPCEIFPSDLRLSCPSGLMTYPDCQVICGPLEYKIGTDDTVTNPKVIVEVLSKSTESYDRGQKFAFYREIPTFQEYVLVAWQAPLIERFHRQSDSGWLLTEAKGINAVLNLPVIGCTLVLAEVFRGVEFPVLPVGLIGREEGTDAE